MGREVARAVHAAEGLQVVAAVDPAAAGRDLGELTGLPGLSLEVHADMPSALSAVKPDVMVDFTVAAAARGNIRQALEAGVRPVVGTTGISQDEWASFGALAESKGIGVFYAPNFAIGAVLMMAFAAKAARYMPAIEIIELHHDQKKDAPSGTALRTAQMIAEAAQLPPRPATEHFTVEGARGGAVGSVQIHSVRLPGYVAHQEVILGGLGQTLTIRHDSLSRESFMPGVVMAVRKVMDLKGLVVGLEQLLEGI
jgi:4-hydroxy-tetrahydrodipicolinate reductase